MVEKVQSQGRGPGGSRGDLYDDLEEKVCILSGRSLYKNVHLFFHVREAGL